jgi:hypothetical protein
MITKCCSKCKIEKPSTSEFFGKHKKTADNLHYWCKQCVNKASKNYYQIEENRLSKNTYVSQYNKSYSVSDKGKAVRKRYNQSLKGKETIKNYTKTEHHKLYVKTNHNKLGAGVYEITNLLTGYSYVGESIKLQRRKYDHFSIHTNCYYTNPFLQEDMKKYSPDAFSFTILEHLPADKKILLEREKYWINKLNPKYNIK